MESDKVKLMVRQALRESIGFSKEHQPEEKIEIELTESQIQEIEDSLVEEGFGRAVAKAATMAVTGLSVGAAGGAFSTAGGAIAGWLLSALGLIATTSIIPVALAAGAGGGLYALYHGAKFAGKAVDKSAGSESLPHAVALAKATEDRDELLLKAESNPDQADKLASALDRATQKQVAAAKMLEKSVARDVKLDLIDYRQQSTYREIIKAAKDGKLTYLGK